MFIGPEIPVGADKPGVSQHAPSVSDQGVVVWREDVGVMSLIRASYLRDTGEPIVGRDENHHQQQRFPRPTKPTVAFDGFYDIFVWEEMSPLGGAIHDLVIKGEDDLGELPVALGQNSIASESFGRRFRESSAGLGDRKCLVLSTVGAFLESDYQSIQSTPFPSSATASPAWTGSRFLAGYYISDTPPPCSICVSATSLRVAEVDAAEFTT